MGQTLTHGVYLPDEGERNCYSGLAANWQILDGSVGTIAAHTAALAGKAPAVHTHTKSGVTDLLNSNFIPSANDAYDLGSASKQWLNTYSKGYYYNGVAWGLDKVNTWSNYNIYSKGIALQGDRYTYILPEFSANASGLSILTNSYGKSVKFGTYTIDENDVVSLDTTLGYIEVKAGNTNNANSVTIYPRNAVVAELGLSNRKWTAFNGVNPGALSLPVTALNNTYDISGNITDLTGGNNAITAARTGWIFVKSDNATEISIENTITGMGASDHSAVAATLMVSIPVTSGETLNIIANCTSIDKAYLLPCQGNV